MNNSISNFNNKHAKWMLEAMKVGKQALDLNEVPVGCIILNKDEVIIGKGKKLNNRLLLETNKYS